MCEKGEVEAVGGGETVAGISRRCVCVWRWGWGGGGVLVDVLIEKRMGRKKPMKNSRS